jgi:hypothetical protein
MEAFDMAWHEILPSLGDFINKTGFPIALWVIAGFAFYKVFKKFFTKLEPIMDAHFELVTQLKDSTGKTVEVLEKQNEILVNNFNVHTSILNDHTEKLNQIMKINVERNEILEETKKIIPMPNGLATAAGVANGLKR